ncbi:MAG: leucine-rich repeat domain-containing protein [Clostridia bacterium]|nr:leucine-rich repeat domain-containing protein [Clostridia bacterium]MBR5427209.1 leucine-rich repeat domain-containing protein [Clostridia bacterium]
MSHVIFNLFLVTILTLFATFNINPFSVIQTQPVGDGDPNTPYTFSTEQDYLEYYNYANFSDPDDEWPNYSISARKNVVKEDVADGYYVTLFKNKTAQIRGLTDPTQDVIIPSEIEGYKVTAIYKIINYRMDENLDQTINSIKTVVIPSSVEYIMEDAFSDLINLKSVQFGGREKYMGLGAFSDCRNLTNIVLPDSLEAIPPAAFADCYGLTKLTIGKNVNSIGYNAFVDCFFLKSVTLPDSVVSLGQECFCWCKCLTYVYIPASAEAIDSSAFLQSNRVTIHGEAGSYAETFAQQNGIPFVAGK